ncbi:histone H2B.3-like [Discoglossus pictus]
MKPVAVIRKLEEASLRKRALQTSNCSIGKAKHGHAKHLYRIRKQQHLEFLNGDLTSDGLGQIASEAARLSHHNKRRVISSHEINSALKQLSLNKH